MQLSRISAIKAESGVRTIDFGRTVRVLLHHDHGTSAASGSAYRPYPNPEQFTGNFGPIHGRIQRPAAFHHLLPDRTLTAGSICRRSIREHDQGSPTRSDDIRLSSVLFYCCCRSSRLAWITTDVLADQRLLMLFGEQIGGKGRQSMNSKSSASKSLPCSSPRPALENEVRHHLSQVRTFFLIRACPRRC